MQILHFVTPLSISFIVYRLSLRGGDILKAIRISRMFTITTTTTITITITILQYHLLWLWFLSELWCKPNPHILYLLNSLLLLLFRDITFLVPIIQLLPPSHLPLSLISLLILILININININIYININIIISSLSKSLITRSNVKSY